MKKMSCKQLGGACEKEFYAETFDEIIILSQKHNHEMLTNKDIVHMNAMESMRELMRDPVAMNDWLDEKRKEFESLP